MSSFFLLPARINLDSLSPAPIILSSPRFLVWGEIFSSSRPRLSQYASLIVYAWMHRTHLLSSRQAATTARGSNYREKMCIYLYVYRYTRDVYNILRILTLSRCTHHESYEGTLSVSTRILFLCVLYQFKNFLLSVAPFISRFVCLTSD